MEWLNKDVEKDGKYQDCLNHLTKTNTNKKKALTEMWVLLLLKISTLFKGAFLYPSEKDVNEQKSEKD